MLVKHEFETLVTDASSMRTLHAFGIVVGAFVDFVRFIFPGEGELSLTHSYQLIIKL